MFRRLKIGFDPSARNPISATPTTPSSTSRHHLICSTPHSLSHPFECVSSLCTFPDFFYGTDNTFSRQYLELDRTILAPMSTSPKRRASCRTQVLGAQDLDQREGWWLHNLFMLTEQDHVAPEIPATRISDRKDWCYSTILRLS